MKFTYTEKKDTRSGFGAGLAELADKNPNVVALCADLIGSLKMEKFIEKAPERFVQTGIAEANMMGIAAGLATAGKIPFAGTFANFATSRVLDQVRQSIAYSNKNVKIAASHAGLTLGEDGATHQVLEDIGQMKMLPGMVVINPCDYNQTKQATLAAAEYEGPVYLRFGRPVVPVFIPEDMPFEIGKGILLQEGKDVTIVATGHLVWESLLAAEELEKEGISCEVIDLRTGRPMDTEAILKSVKKTNRLVILEEAWPFASVASEITYMVQQKAFDYLDAPIKRITTKDTSAPYAPNLYETWIPNAKDVVEAVKAVMYK